MFKITHYDWNCSPICDGVINFFAEDIEEFQRRWFALLDLKGGEYELKEKFLRSKAGELVTDYYSGSPEFNIVQYDEGELFGEKTVETESVTFEAYNAYDCPSRFHVNKWNIRFRWISFKGKYYRIAAYRASGVCEYKDYSDRWGSVCCYGNPVLENTVSYDPIYEIRKTDEWENPNFEDFSENTLETICWLVSAYFNNERELKDDISGFEISEEIMGKLFDDVVGEAG